MLNWIKDRWNRLFKRGFYAKNYTQEQMAALMEYAALGTCILKFPQKHP